MRQHAESTCPTAPHAPLQAKAKLADAQRENGILKRAVQIQNTKLMERAGQEQEVAQLRHMLVSLAAVVVGPGSGRQHKNAWFSCGVRRVAPPH